MKNARPSAEPVGRLSRKLNVSCTYHRWSENER
jgi:hypothetical protein